MYFDRYKSIQYPKKRLKSSNFMVIWLSWVFSTSNLSLDEVAIAASSSATSVDAELAVRTFEITRSKSSSSYSSTLLLSECHFHVQA